jgi:hypothetical protein
MRRSLAFSPRVEVLGDRTVPAVMSDFTNGVLSITANDGTTAVDHDISVSTTGDSLTVTADGQTQTFMNASALNTVNVTTGGGNDKVMIDLTGSTSKAMVGVNADLGAGDDTLTVTGNGSTAVNANLGAGNDTATVNLGSTLTKGSVGVVAVRGGAGDDTITVNADSVGTGAILLNDIQGGAGNDNASLNVGTAQKGSVVFSNVMLGQGDDTFNWTGTSVAKGAAVGMTVNGGLGSDKIAVDAGALDKGANFFSLIRLNGDTSADTVTLSSSSIANGAGALFNISGATTTGTSALDTIDQTGLNTGATVLVNGVLQNSNTGNTGGDNDDDDDDNDNDQGNQGPGNGAAHGKGLALGKGHNKADTDNDGD